jgi:hypothetical protein
MKNKILIFLIYTSLIGAVAAQSDTLGRGFYHRSKTYESGMANVWKEDDILMDSVWVCCDTIINHKQYVKYGTKEQSRGYYVAEQDGDIWIFDNDKQEEYLYIPQHAPIGYNIHIRNFSITILDNKATFKIYDVVFDELIKLDVIWANEQLTSYFKRGVGMIAEFRNGQLVHILERNIFNKINNK